jgi:hypothetical protein
MSHKLTLDIVELLLQLIVLGIIGGGVSWYYSKVQKQRELRIALLREFTGLHGQFLSLRYRANSFYFEWKGPRSSANHPLTEDEMRKARWTHFQESCALLGTFYGVKPLLQSQFRGIHDEFELIHRSYQQWRHKISNAELILQDTSGKNSDEFNQLRETYQTVIQRMRHQM